MAAPDFTGNKPRCILIHREITVLNERRIYQCNYFRFGGIDEYLFIQPEERKSIKQRRHAINRMPALFIS